MIVFPDINCYLNIVKARSHTAKMNAKATSLIAIARMGCEPILAISLLRSLLLHVNSTIEIRTH